MCFIGLFVTGRVWDTFCHHSGSWTRMPCLHSTLQNLPSFHLTISLIIMRKDFARSLFLYLCVCVCVCVCICLLSYFCSSNNFFCCMHKHQMWMIIIDSPVLICVANNNDFYTNIGPNFRGGGPLYYWNIMRRFNLNPTIRFESDWLIRKFWTTNHAYCYPKHLRRCNWDLFYVYDFCSKSIHTLGAICNIVSGTTRIHTSLLVCYSILFVIIIRFM